ncbi:ARF/SAR family small GTPase [Pelomyxa schiedti]|nr:ARF/SAR family small GTPase [Pelomyxa schiedti]
MVSDFGGTNLARSMWHYYYDDTGVFIWVADAHDRGRIRESRDALQEALRNTALRNALVLVLANKNDLPDSLSKSELADMLEMHNVKNKWTIQPTSAITGMGFAEGLDWVCSNLP